MNINLNWFQ